MKVNCAQHHLKNSEGFRPSQNVFYFHSPAFWRGSHELTIEERLRLLLHRSEVHGQQICQFDKLATYSFWHQFWRNRGMSRTNDKSLLRLRWCQRRLEAWKTANNAGRYESVESRSHGAGRRRDGNGRHWRKRRNKRGKGKRTWSHRRNTVTCTRTRSGRWRK